MMSVAAAVSAQFRLISVWPRHPTSRCKKNRRDSFEINIIYFIFVINVVRQVHGTLALRANIKNDKVAGNRK